MKVVIKDDAGLPKDKYSFPGLAGDEKLKSQAGSPHKFGTKNTLLGDEIDYDRKLMLETSAARDNLSSPLTRSRGSPIYKASTSIHPTKRQNLGTQGNSMR